MTMWEPQYEKMPREELERLQLERLQRQVKYVYDNVPFYHTKFQQMRITPDDIKSLDDVNKLPFTSKTDFKDNYPYGLLAVPLTEVMRAHASSGTTGKPIIAPYNAQDMEERDLEQWLSQHLQATQNARLCLYRTWARLFLPVRLLML